MIATVRRNYYAWKWMEKTPLFFEINLLDQKTFYRTFKCETYVYEVYIIIYALQINKFKTNKMCNCNTRTIPATQE